MSDVARYLGTFLAVCEEGGFHRAAEKVHLSQPAVTYQMRLLETLLKVTLFERSGRGVVLTDRGRLLREYSRKAENDLAALESQLLRGDESFVGTLRIAAVSAFGRYVLFPILKKRFASIPLDLRFPTQDEVLKLIAAGVSDIGFVYEPKVSNLLTCQPVAEEELVLVGTRDLLGARRSPRLEELAAIPFVTYEESEYVFGRWFATYFGRQPMPLKSSSNFEDLEEVMEFVAAGRGLSIVPDHCARVPIDSGAVRVLRPHGGKRCVNELYAITRSGSPLSREAAAVLDALRSAGQRTRKKGLSRGGMPPGASRTPSIPRPRRP